MLFFAGHPKEDGIARVHLLAVARGLPGVPFPRADRFPQVVAVGNALENEDAHGSAPCSNYLNASFSMIASRAPASAPCLAAIL